MMYVPVTGPVAPVVQDVWLYVKLPNDDVPVPLAKPCSGSGAQAAFGPTDAVAVADPEKLMSTAEAGEAHKMAGASASAVTPLHARMFMTTLLFSGETRLTFSVPTKNEGLLMGV